MIGNDKLRKENQALCEEIEELKNKLHKVQVIAELLCVIYFELQSARLCIRLILDTWMNGVQIPHDPIGQVRRIVSNSSCKVTHKGTITETTEIMPQKPKNIIILRATTLAETSIHLRSLGKLKSQHLYRENWRIIVNVGHSK